MTSAGLYLLLLGCVAIERGVELWLSKRNARVMLARGGREVGAASFTIMRAMHLAFLPACALEVVLLGRTFSPALGIPMLGLALAAQALRYWAIRTLGPAWNVRIIVTPCVAIARGPYRFLRHPNYLAVIVELFALPLVHGAWLCALLFSAANAWILRSRIRLEEAALASVSAYGELFADTPRLWPTRAASGRR